MDINKIDIGLRIYKANNVVMILNYLSAFDIILK